MGFWRQVLGLGDESVSVPPTPRRETPKTRTLATRAVNLGDGVGFEMGIVGESYYGLEIKRIAGDRLKRGEEVVFTASLVRDPENQYDANAVAVIGSFGKKIGHLSRDYAIEYQALLQRLEAQGLTATCSAKMFGGTERKPSVGVWLDIEPADVLMARFSTDTAEQAF